MYVHLSRLVKLIFINYSVSECSYRIPYIKYINSWTIIVIHLQIHSFHIQSKCQQISKRHISSWVCYSKMIQTLSVSCSLPVSVWKHVCHFQHCLWDRWDTNEIWLDNAHNCCQAATKRQFWHSVPLPGRWSRKLWHLGAISGRT